MSPYTTPTLLSHSPALTYTALAIGTTFVGFSINALVRPASALSFMADQKLPPQTPSTEKEYKVIKTLLHFYAARNAFMGLGIYVAAYAGERSVLGALVVLGGGVAFADGLACKVDTGRGEWDHWGYAPVLVGVGLGLLGVMDRV